MQVCAGVQHANRLQGLPGDIMTETMCSKYLSGKITRTEYDCWRIQKKGFDSWYVYSTRMAYALQAFRNLTEYGNIESLYNMYQTGKIRASDYASACAVRAGYSNRSEYITELLEDRGFSHWSEYGDYIAIRNGYKNYKEQRNSRDYRNGKRLPMSENKECSAYLGVHIAERQVAIDILSKIYKEVVPMSYNNHGYDILCDGYKVDVKSACLEHPKKRWKFGIHKNKVADYFLLLAFDNRDSLTSIHSWLLKATEVIGDSRVNEKTSLSVTNTEKSMRRLGNYEVR